MEALVLLSSLGLLPKDRAESLPPSHVRSGSQSQNVYLSPMTAPNAAWLANRNTEATQETVNDAKEEMEAFGASTNADDGEASDRRHPLVEGPLPMNMKNDEKELYTWRRPGLGNWDRRGGQRRKAS